MQINNLVKSPLLALCMHKYLIFPSHGYYRKAFIIAISLILILSASLTLAAETLIKIGVLANRGAEQCLTQWSPTADYLTATLPGRRFEIVPLAFEEVIQVVEQEAVDFILVNSSLYVELEVNHAVDRIATLKNKRLNGTYTTFGGVIFCLKARENIQATRDLKGKSFMAVERKSFGGWYMAWR